MADLYEKLNRLAHDKKGRTFEELVFKIFEEGGEVAKQTRTTDFSDDEWVEETLLELGDVLSATLKAAWSVGYTPTELIDLALEKRAANPDWLDA
jgi:NTP pyrophosphatase (non-canonical NTP hydrolase)